MGHLTRDVGGPIAFVYDADWLAWRHAIPVSLSLPMREDAYRGAPVVAVFENLLPDSDALRRRVAERTGAAGTDAYSLLATIGRDCVGALQFLPVDHPPSADGAIESEPLDDAAIERLLRNLAQAPLGLSRDDDFRISVAGVQEKTALLWYRDRWHKPLGTTPTTHLLKPPIGTLPNGIDLSWSVDNEFYCLRLAAAFGLPTNRADIHTFGGTRTLVVERFDRSWTRDGRLLRLPQEDCCQALSTPPTRKYQSDGGPSLVDVLTLLRGSDAPSDDQMRVFKAQVVFWLIGATDGHAKNFSLFLGPGGIFHLTPLYDVLSAQPSLDARQVERKQMKLAMSVGAGRHYRIDEIRRRHFEQTGDAARLSKSLVRDALDSIADTAADALACVESNLPPDFPAAIHDSVAKAVRKRLPALTRRAREA